MQVEAGERPCDTLHVDDAAKAIVMLAEGTAADALVNVAHPVPDTYGTVARAIATMSAAQVVDLPRTVDTIVRPALDTTRLHALTGWRPVRSVAAAACDTLSALAGPAVVP